MTNIFIANQTIKGSAKVQGFEQAIEAWDVWEYGVSCEFAPEKAGGLQQTSAQRFTGLGWKAAVGRDTVLALQCLDGGKNVGPVTVSEVMAVGTDNEVNYQLNFGAPNGSSYVNMFMLVYNPENDPDGTGLFYSAYVTSDGFEATATIYDQSKTATGKQSASISGLNQTASGKS